MQRAACQHSDRLDKVVILQCLSTFYDATSEANSTIAFAMISSYVDLSTDTVTHLLLRMEEQGYVAVYAEKRGARLDPQKWKQMSDNCSRLRTLAYYVSNAPPCLRDDDSLQPHDPRCCYVPQREVRTGCATTATSNFNGVYNTFTNTELCCPPPGDPPLELVFVPRCCADAQDRCSRNLTLSVEVRPLCMQLMGPRPPTHGLPRVRRVPFQEALGAWLGV